jgi:hypothetical protein
MKTESSGVESLVRDFVAHMMEAAEFQAGERLRSAVASALTASPRTSSAGYHKLGAKTLAVRRLQGRYLGALRSLPPEARNRVKKVAREKGVADAVALAKSLK